VEESVRGARVSLSSTMKTAPHLPVSQMT